MALRNDFFIYSAESLLEALMGGTRYHFEIGNSYSRSYALKAQTIIIISRQDGLEYRLIEKTRNEYEDPLCHAGKLLWSQLPDMPHDEKQILAQENRYLLRVLHLIAQEKKLTLPITDPQQQLQLLAKNKRYIAPNRKPEKSLYSIFEIIHPSIQLQFLTEHLSDLQLTINDLKLILESLYNEKDRIEFYQLYKNNVVEAVDSDSWLIDKPATWADVLKTLPVAYRFNLATELLQIQAGKVKAEHLISALPPTERYEFYKSHAQAPVTALSCNVFSEFIWQLREEEKLLLLAEYEGKIENADDLDKVLDQIIVLEDPLWRIHRYTEKREAPLTEKSFPFLKDFIFRKKGLITTVDQLTKLFKRLSKIGFTSNDIYQTLLQDFDKLVQNPRDLYKIINELVTSKTDQSNGELYLSYQHGFELVTTKHADKLKMPDYAEKIIELICMLINGPIRVADRVLNIIEARSWFVRQFSDSEVLIRDQTTLVEYIQRIAMPAEIPNLLQKHQSKIEYVYALSKIAERLPPQSVPAFVEHNLKACMKDFDDYRQVLELLHKIDAAYMLRVALEYAEMIQSEAQLQQVLALFTREEDKQKVVSNVDSLIKSKEDLMKRLDAISKSSQQIKLIEAKKSLLVSSQDMTDVLIKVERCARHVVLIALKDKLDEKEFINILTLMIPVEFHKQCHDARGALAEVHEVTVPRRHLG